MEYFYAFVVYVLIVGAILALFGCTEDDASQCAEPSYE
jgi:hypothetical protein